VNAKPSGPSVTRVPDRWLFRAEAALAVDEFDTARAAELLVEVAQRETTVGAVVDIA
jgi:hypothetical protein